MKNTHKAAQRRSFRRWVRRLITSWLKRHTRDCREDTQKILEKLDDLEETIEIIAREIARWSQPDG